MNSLFEINKKEEDFTIGKAEISARRLQRNEAEINFA